jgi:hypothetical protein
MLVISRFSYLMASVTKVSDTPVLQPNEVNVDAIQVGRRESQCGLVNPNRAKRDPKLQLNFDEVAGSCKRERVDFGECSRNKCA